MKETKRSHICHIQTLHRLLLILLWWSSLNPLQMYSFKPTMPSLGPTSSVLALFDHPCLISNQPLDFCQDLQCLYPNLPVLQKCLPVRITYMSANNDTELLILLAHSECWNHRCILISPLLVVHFDWKNPALD